MSVDSERIERLRRAGAGVREFLRLSLQDRMEARRKSLERLRGSYLTPSAWQDATLVLAGLDERAIEDIEAVMNALGATPDE